MSIPPLVCSTPPPPDQCEDDKDHDEYELQYNLSQEDEENNDYDFGNYPTFNHFQAHSYSKQENIPSNVIKCEESVDTKDSGDKISVCSENEICKSDIKIRTNDSGENKLENDEDIEDLNLKMDSESPGSSMKDISSGDENSKHENLSSMTSIHIPKVSSASSPEEDSYIPTSTVETESIENQSNKLEDLEKDNLQVLCDDVMSIDEQTTEDILDSATVNEIIQEPIHEPTHMLKDSTSDDFGDFDEFQFIALESKPSTFIDNCENPWENKDEENSDFGNFTANFDNDEIVVYKTDAEASDENHSEADCANEQNDDDSFGDFDDFQSSTVQMETKIPSEEIGPYNTVPVLNLQSTENEVQIMESINKVLISLFEEEISQPINEVELKLESFLSETWGHLTETDVRQPYIINWNSSLGQKTLLKALCIDSRNILFGPKWSHNMPKYAANLSSAPLQPQKQLSNPTQAEATSSEKTSKSMNWSNPFTANGQESCTTENESNIAESRASDLEVFESAISSKPEKIFSSTLNVQPIRQINLPDTHIFTPTDSETPRSKTIHYDNNSTSLLPQPIITDKNKKQIHCATSQSSHSNEGKAEDDEYWEFQEFKTTPSVNHLTEGKNEHSIEKSEEIVTISNPLPKPSMAYQTQLLQPIKIEPAIPTLNWPDPGEVKEEFDVFSDFVSSSSWIDKNLHDSKAAAIKSTNINEITTEMTTEPNKQTDSEIKKFVENNIDDDFDTFQSALPSIKDNIELNIEHVDNQPNTNSLSYNINQIDFGRDISTESVKTETISFDSNHKSTEPLPHNLSLMMKTTKPPNRNSPVMGTQTSMNLLQPIPASSSGTLPSNQQKSGQILQPLSLESYSQINWPSPGIDLQDLSRFNPVETLHSLKSDLSVSGQSKSSPIHNSKPAVSNQVQEDDVWGEFVSSKPSPQLSQTKKQMNFGDDDEWTDFVSSPSVKPHNGLNTISLNVHTNLNMQKTSQNKFNIKTNQISLDIPTLNYITPKTNNHKAYNDRHFQNL